MRQGRINTSRSQTDSGLLLRDSCEESPSEGLREGLSAGKLGGKSGSWQGGSPGQSGEGAKAGTREN